MKKRCVCFAFCLLLLLALPPRAGAAETFPAFLYEGQLSYAIGGLSAGERVRLYEAEDEKYYIVGNGSGRVKVPWDAILPLPVRVAAVPFVTGEKIASFAGEHFRSATDYLLWVDLSRLQLYVLEYADEGWGLLRTLPCSVGDGAHPTPSGQFAVSYKCASIGKENKYLCRYALCFYGSYMIHSTLFDWAGTAALDSRLGQRISHGCVRVSHNDSLWLYQNIPIGTAVVVR